MNIIYTLLPVFILAMLTAAWMGVQLLAKRSKIKNHIDDGGGCCGACDLKEKGQCDSYS